MKPFPNKKYNIIYADPPWSYHDQSCGGGLHERVKPPIKEAYIKEQYATMDIEDICSLPVQNICEKDCVLFLWATYPMLREALRVCDAWGFTFKSIAFQWIKMNKKDGQPFYGLGRWTRGNTEPCLLATKGKPKRDSNSVFQLILEAPITGHSAKPHAAGEKIVELMGDLPRIELFARRRMPGWDAWGDDAGLETQQSLLGGPGKYTLVN